MGNGYQVDVIVPQASKFWSLPQGIKIIDTITIDFAFYWLLFIFSEKMMDLEVLFNSVF